MQDGDNARPGVQYHSLENHHKDHLPKAGNLCEKNERGSDGFDQCVTEYLLGEYHQKIEQPGS